MAYLYKSFILLLLNLKQMFPGGMITAYVQGLGGKPEGKRPLGRPKRRWEDGIIKGLGETGYRRVEWIQLAQGSNRWRAPVNATMNLRILSSQL
jgi:hypothetical protein